MVFLEHPWSLKSYFRQFKFLRYPCLKHMCKFEVNSGLFSFIHIALWGAMRGEMCLSFPGLSFNINAIFLCKFGCYKSIGRKRIHFLSSPKRGHISEDLQKRHGWRKNCWRINDQDSYNAFLMWMELCITHSETQWYSWLGSVPPRASMGAVYLLVLKIHSHTCLFNGSVVKGCTNIQKIDTEQRPIVYSTGNSTQYSVISYMGKESEKEWTHIYL